ncbi:MAG TPA: hypothetical protein VHB21_13520 [Minicystis sp.]|nr:hypothetical protein [Minicystis sp.]
MSGALQHAGGDGPARCTFCSAEAVGPCAACRAPVCGDCCTLTEGGAKTWAICLDCDRKHGRSLRGAWLRFGLFLGVIVLGLAVLVAVLSIVSQGHGPASP